MNAETVIAAILADGKIVRFEADGDSMYPLIRSGDRLLVEPVAPRALRRGDVVLARLDRGLTAHRIVRIDGATITMRGDNCDVDDPPFAPAQLLGRVRAVEREGRTFGTRRGLMKIVARYIRHAVQRIKALRAH